jgi:hypothetical protein
VVSLLNYNTRAFDNQQFRALRPIMPDLLRRVVVLLFALLSACDRRVPGIDAFQAERATVEAGTPVALRWDAPGALHVWLEPGVGEVSGRSAAIVTPALTTVYTLRTLDAQGRKASAALTLNVTQAPAPAVAYPILFVTQTPLHTDFAARLSAFANHQAGVAQAPRGGDLMLRYPDGALRNLTREAGFGEDGSQGAGAIAVREPSVSLDGAKAVFSMAVGARPEDDAAARWQLYEVSGLGRGERAHIGKVPDQPAQYNNVAPLYAGDGAILFTSDRPPGGAHLYPPLDEYEATPTVSGIWRLERGRVRLLNHAPSGVFSPTIDSYGRVIFTRWDHLQQDQLAERDRDAAGNGVVLPFRSFNFTGEAAGAAATRGRAEVFPESRAGAHGPYGAVNAFTANFFTAWQMNQDGTGEETLNHAGQHELAFGFQLPTFRDDPALSDRTLDTLHANRLALRREGGLFHLREDPRRPGSFVATRARESASFTTGQLLRLSGSPALQAEQMTLSAVTAGDPGDALAGGRFRNPLPLSDGRLVASHTRTVRAPEEGGTLDGLRLRWLALDAGGLYRAGAALTPGIRKSLSWWTPTGVRRYDGLLWELEAVEVRPRAAPVRAADPLPAPERAVLAEEGVGEDALRRWLRDRDLALIVTRNQTSRDRAELQQPFNLQVPGGVRTVSRERPGKVYDIAHFQLFQADQIRAYPGRPGRRVLAQPLHDGLAANPANAQGPAGSVRIARDGSTAAFVPARRALTWQTTDPAGVAVVRERNWITFQAGEMRVCASCHGVNKADQAGQPAPLNKPEALRELLAHWKRLQK